MKLTTFDLYRYRLPFASPLNLKGAALHHREGLLLELKEEGGAAGWGEVSPLPGFSRESLEEATDQLRSLVSSMTGHEVACDRTGLIDEMGGELDLRAIAPSVRFGFELAVWNLCAARDRVSLAALISPHPRASVPLNGLLTGSPEHVFEEARRMRDAGFRAVKLKVGGRGVDEDLKLVRALSEEIGAAVALRLDANRAWSFEEALGFAGGSDEVRYEYIEEPLADPSRLPELVQRCGIPVALDESLAGMEPEALEDHRYARAVVLKPTFLGGVSSTLRLAESALRLGMTPVISSAYETGIGTPALVALAAGIGAEEVPAGLDTYRRLAGDVSRPRLDFSEPRVRVKELPSSRREIDHRWLITVE